MIIDIYKKCLCAITPDNYLIFIKQDSHEMKIEKQCIHEVLDYNYQLKHIDEIDKTLFVGIYYCDLQFEYYSNVGIEYDYDYDIKITNINKVNL